MAERPPAPLRAYAVGVFTDRPFTPLVTGRLGYALRVSSNHYTDPLNRPCYSPLKWMGEPAM